MLRRGLRGSHLVVLLGYALVAIALSWPLALHLGTHLTASPAGDTGVYVWNQWVFQHELLDHRRLPYFTDAIFPLTPDTNLSLHNYTTFQDLLALPLIRVLGVVTTFNVVYLAMVVLTAFSTYLLTRHITGRVAESWLAGLCFAWSPILVTRGMGHFSLVAAAPLAIFLLVLLKADGQERFRDAVALGAVMWWAASTDVYYAVYCLLLGVVFLVARVISIHRSPRSGRIVAVRWGLDVVLLCAAGLVASIAASGGWASTFAGRAITVRGLYTPTLLLTMAGLLRLAWGLRASAATMTRIDVVRITRYVVAAGVVATVLLSPVLYAVSVRIAGGQFVSPQILWRSSPGGIDLLSLVLPNPNHPYAPLAVIMWLMSLPAGYLESVVSIPFVLVATVAVAWWTGWRPSKWWAGVALTFGALALGPFIHIAGINTYVPGPWALLRYVPIIGLARSPSRFAVVMTLAFVVLFATALEWIGRRYPRRRGALLAAIGVVLLAELLPAPLTLYSATVPHFYERIAATPGAVRVLELPTGVRDGTSSVGNFTARTQFFQTAHGKSLLGGYLSRVSKGEISAERTNEVYNALVVLSEGGALSAGQDAALVDRGPAFIHDTRIAYVVIDREWAPAALQSFAQRAFGLEFIEVDGSLMLYRPR